MRRFRRLLNGPYLLKLWNIMAFSSYLHCRPALDKPLQTKNIGAQVGPPIHKPTNRN